MADFELRAGAKLSLLSDHESRQEFDRLRRAITAAGFPPTTELVNDVVAVDGNGNLGGGINGQGAVLYQVPTGRTALLHRVQVWDGIHVPAPAGLAGATGGDTIVTPGNPAAAADFAVPVPAGQIWTVRSVTATLTASATVANRVPALQLLSPSAAIIARSPSDGNQTAGQTTIYTWAPGAPLSGAPPATVTSPIPSVALAPGSSINSITAGLSAGDQWSSIVLDVVATSTGGTLSSGWWALFRNNVQNSGLILAPTASSVIPFLSSDGRENAAQVRNGERIVIAGAGLPAGLSIGISLQVGLYETARGSRGDERDPHAAERGAPVIVR